MQYADDYRLMASHASSGFLLNAHGLQFVHRNHELKTFLRVSLPYQSFLIQKALPPPHLNPHPSVLVYLQAFTALVSLHLLMLYSEH